MPIPDDLLTNSGFDALLGVVAGGLLTAAVGWYRIYSDKRVAAHAADAGAEAALQQQVTARLLGALDSYEALAQSAADSANRARIEREEMVRQISDLQSQVKSLSDEVHTLNAFIRDQGLTPPKRGGRRGEG